MKYNNLLLNTNNMFINKTNFIKNIDEIYKILGNNFIYGSEANYIVYSIYCNLLDS